MQTESSIGATSAPSDAGVISTVGAPESSRPSTMDTSLAPPSTASTPTAENVQGQEGTSEDPFELKGLPTDEELATADTVSKKAFLEIKGAFDPLKANYKDLQAKFSPYEGYLERFEKPEQLQSLLELQDSLLAWDTDPQTGQPIPTTRAAAERLHTEHQQHANDLTAQLLEMPVVDSVTGREMSRWEIVLHGMADDPAERARALQILRGVEPSAIAPQWQPTEEELAVVKPELQDFYRTLPYEDRVELKENSPEFINKTLQQLKLTEDLQAERTRYQQQEQQRQQQRETYINQQAQAAGNDYVTTQLNEALTTFHQSVVQQCNFIKPLDPANLPQGMSPEQAATMNQQIERANKSEAVQMTSTIIGLLNPEVRGYVLPLMKEVGLIDDRTLGSIEAAASVFGNNARNYGNLLYRGKLSGNGNYQPDGDVTKLNNEASRALKSLVGYANQIRGALMDTRSSFFELRAQQHNATLDSAGAVRPQINGQGFNPTTAPANGQRLPASGLSRQELDRLYG
jgi:hypothetical protein